MKFEHSAKERDEFVLACIKNGQRRRCKKMPRAGSIASCHDGVRQTRYRLHTDEDVRSVAHAMLEELDYMVREADNAQRALERSRVDAAIDLVFSEVIMNGVQLAAVIKVEYQTIPCCCVRDTSRSTSHPK